MFQHKNCKPLKARGRSLAGTICMGTLTVLFLSFVVALFVGTRLPSARKPSIHTIYHIQHELKSSSFIDIAYSGNDAGEPQHSQFQLILEAAKRDAKQCTTLTEISRDHSQLEWRKVR